MPRPIALSVSFFRMSAFALLATADSAHKVAGMMAAGAAQDTMLSAISRRAFADGSNR